jgi:excisionase family DNA binding protein
MIEGMLVWCRYEDSYMAMDEYFTPEQIASRLSVTRHTVYEWLKCGKLKGTKLGPKMWRVTSSQLHALIYPETVMPDKPAHFCKPPVIGNHRYGDTWMCPFCNIIWSLTVDEASADVSAYWDKL